MQGETSNGPLRLRHRTAVRVLWPRSFFPAFFPRPCKMSVRWRAEWADRDAPQRHTKWQTTPGPAQIASFIGLVRWPCYLSMSVCLPPWGDKQCRNRQGDASALLWRQIRAWLITVVHPRLELPRSPPLLLGESPVQQSEGSDPAVAQQDWEAEGERDSSWVWRGGNLNSGWRISPAVPIWGEKRPRGSSISSIGSSE